MQYQFIERYEYVKSIEFINSNPLQNVTKINFFKEENISGTFISKEYRYSFDNAIWSNWNILTQANLANIEFKNKPNFWLQIKYTRNSIDSGNILNWYLYYDSDTPTPSPTPSDVSIDADTLGGEGPSYYLNRENQTGAFLDLNIENVTDGSTLGVYSSRTDTSLGTTFYFKRIGPLNNDILVSETGGKILIGLSKTTIDSSLSNIYSYIDSSLITRDSSISQLYSMYGTYDSSIEYLTLWDSILDASISFLSTWNIVQDASIVIIKSKLVLVESSLGNLTVWNQYQDSSIINLRSSISKLDSSVIRIDSSISSIFSTLIKLDTSVNYNTNVNIIQDSSIISINTTVQIHDVSISNVYNWQIVQDASIVSLRISLNDSSSKIDGSLNNIFDHISKIDSSLSLINSEISVIDNSIIYFNTWQIVQDASIVSLKQQNIVQDTSLIVLKQWNETQDLSIVNLKTYIDGSLLTRDLSLGNLSKWEITQDSSIIFLRQWNVVQDASIVSLRQWEIIQDLSINVLRQWEIAQDSSIVNLKTYIDGSLLTRDLSLGNLSKWEVTQDLSINVLRQWEIDQDNSIISLRQWNIIQDLSINILKQWEVTQDNSIISLRQWNVVQDASIVSLRQWEIVQDSSIDILRSYILGTILNWDNAQDASIVSLRQSNIIQDTSISSINNNILIIESSIVSIQNDQVINIGDGSIHIYSNRDASNNILLKTIKSLGPIYLKEDSSLITIDASSIKLYDTSIEASTFVPYTVGGIIKGASAGNFINETYTKILDDILFPTVDPSITEPYQTFSFDLSSINLALSNTYVNFTCTFNRGLIDVNGVFENYRSGLPYQYIFTGPDVSGVFASSSLTYTFVNEPIQIPLGLTIWTSKVRYNGGPQPYNNKGGSVGTFLDASITIDSSLYTEGVWPLFATASVINILAQQSLVSMLYGNNVEITLVPETGGYKQRFDIPDEWINSPTNRPLIGIKTYTEVGDVWNWEGGDQTKSLTYWDVSTSTHVIGSNTVNYISYTYNSIDRSTIKVKLIF